MRVVLPAPEDPTSAVRMPGWNVPLQSFSSCSILRPPTSTVRGPALSGSVDSPCAHAWSPCQTLLVTLSILQTTRQHASLLLS